MNLTKTLALTALLILIQTNVSHAVRLYISDIGPGLGTPNRQATPNINLLPGEEADVYIWMETADVPPGGSPENNPFTTISIGIAGFNNRDVVKVTDIEIFNPDLRNMLEHRWWMSGWEYLEASHVYDFRASCFVGCNSIGTPASFHLDPTYNEATNSYTYAKISIEAVDFGSLDLNLQTSRGLIKTRDFPGEVHLGSDAGGLVATTPSGITDGEVHARVNVVPEPSAGLLLLLGMLGVVNRVRKSKNSC